MRKYEVLKIIVGFISVFMVCMLHAHWIPFMEHHGDQTLHMNVISSTNASLTLNVSIPGIETEIVDTHDMLNTQNESFLLLSIPECSYTSDIGEPKLPAIRKTIGVPYDARIEIEITKSTYKDVRLHSLGIDRRMMPVLAPVVKVPGQKPVLVLDNTTYTQDALYPEEIITVKNDDIMRGHRLAVIEIVPIQYNPMTQTIRYYTNLEIRISFIGGDLAKTREMIAQDYSRLYEEFIEQRVLNYDLFENITRGVLPLPIHYLIITHNDFQNQVNNLAFWLKRKGFKVTVANQDSISPWNISNIENYIDAQTPAPTYLLLVGDVNGGYMPAPTGSYSGKVTDLYYAELDGSGYLPDVFYGRLSCENTTHITTIVDKIIKYETADLPTGWFKKDAFLAGNDNYTVSEGTHNYCTSTFMDPHGYTTFKLYEQTYGATTADVTNNVNDGRILTTMSGHGSDDGWYDGPVFTVTHINALTNGDKLTIATGHCCLANNFGYGSTCAGEAWIRKQNGGAVGYYGSCPSTYWDEDDWLEREWYEAIYADEIYEHARFTLDGMYDGVYMGPTSEYYKHYYYEAYHVLGDPSLDLWTEEPDNMIVDHLPIVAPGSGDFDVTVKDNDGTTPLENALVCCWVPNQNPEMHVSEYTDAAGEVTLSISPTMPGDTMFVTVTKHNYTPYEGYVLVTGASGPYIIMGDMTVDDNGGDGQVNPGEDINLSMWAKNIGIAPGVGVYGLLLESDPYVMINAASSWFGTIPQDDSAFSHTDFVFSVDSTCPDMHVIHFTLLFHDFYDSVWTAYPECIVYSNVGVGDYDDFVQPTRTMLQTIYPNPFSTMTDIKYQISEPMQVNLIIYDVNGRIVKTFSHNEIHNPGYYTKHWDGLDDNGYPVAHGVYFVQFKTSELTTIEKIILVK